MRKGMLADWKRNGTSLELRADETVLKASTTKKVFFAGCQLHENLDLTVILGPI